MEDKEHSTFLSFFLTHRRTRCPQVLQLLIRKELGHFLLCWLDIACNFCSLKLHSADLGWFKQRVMLQHDVGLPNLCQSPNAPWLILHSVVLAYIKVQKLLGQKHGVVGLVQVIRHFLLSWWLCSGGWSSTGSTWANTSCGQIRLHESLQLFHAPGLSFCAHFLLGCEMQGKSNTGFAKHLELHGLLQLWCLELFPKGCKQRLHLIDLGMHLLGLQTSHISLCDELGHWINNLLCGTVCHHQSNLDHWMQSSLCKLGLNNAGHELFSKGGVGAKLLWHECHKVNHATIRSTCNIFIATYICHMCKPKQTFQPWQTQMKWVHNKHDLASIQLNKFANMSSIVLHRPSMTKVHSHLGVVEVLGALVLLGQDNAAHQLHFILHFICWIAGVASRLNQRRHGRPLLGNNIFDNSPLPSLLKHTGQLLVLQEVVSQAPTRASYGCLTGLATL